MCNWLFVVVYSKQLITLPTAMVIIVKHLSNFCTTNNNYDLWLVNNQPTKKPTNEKLSLDCLFFGK